MWLSDLLQPLLMLAALSWLLVRSFSAPPPTPPAVAAPETSFQKAIARAAVRSEDHVFRRLLALRDDNPDLRWRTDEHQEVLVVAFVSTDTAERYYLGPDGTPRSATTPAGQPLVWVTLVPELQRFCRRQAFPHPGERLKEYLGLPPDGDYEALVEMWVARDDLLRPCPDPETDDTACELMSTGEPPQVKNVADYRHFLLSLHERSYTPGGAPWTGLGYTYDYAHGGYGIGASEYMLVPEAAYEVRSVSTPTAYCAPG